MAMVVPDYGNFQVTPNESGLAREASFKGVHPEDTGRILGQGFNRLSGHLGKLQDEQDEARVTESINLLKREQLLQQFGDKDLGREGFQSLNGYNALAPDEEGFSLAQRTDKALKEFSANLADKLTPWQRKKYEERAGSVIESNYRAATSHMMAQGQSYALEQQKGRLSLAQEMVSKNPTDPINVVVALNDAKESVEASARIQGLPSETVSRLVREAESSVLKGGVATLLDRAQETNSRAAIAQAQDLMRTHHEKFTGADLSQLHKAVNAVSDNFKAMDYVNETLTPPSMTTHAKAMSMAMGDVMPEAFEKRAQALANAVNVEGGNRHLGAEGGVRVDGKKGSRTVGAYQVRDDSNLASLIQAGIDLGAIPVGSLKDYNELDDDDRFKLSTSMREKLKDKEFSRRVAERLFTNYLEEYKDETKATVAYLFGEEKAKAMKDGDLSSLSKEERKKLEDVQSVMAGVGATKDTAGNIVSVLDVGANAKFSVIAQSKTAWQAWQETVQAHPEVARDPDFQMKFFGRYDSMRRHQDDDFMRKRKDLLNQVNGILYSRGSLAAVPPSLLEQMTPAEMAEYRKLEQNINGTRERATDLAYYTHWMSAEQAPALAQLSPSEAQNMTLNMSTRDARVFLSHYFKTKESLGGALDAQAQQRKASMDAALRFETPTADTLSPSLVEEAIKQFMPSADYALYRKSVGEVKDGFNWGFRMAIEEGMRAGQLNDKSTPYQIKEWVRKNGGAYVTGDEFGLYGGKRLWQLKMDDFPDRGEQDPRHIIRVLAKNLAENRGQNPESVSHADEEAVLRALLLAPQSVDARLFKGASYGARRLAEMKPAYIAYVKEKYPEVANKLITDWNRMSGQMQMRTYILASLNIKSGTDWFGVGKSVTKSAPVFEDEGGLD